MERDKQLLQTLQAIRKNSLESIITLRYVPIGGNGHIQQVYQNQGVQIHTLGSKLYGLLKEVKEACEVPTLYTIYYDPFIGTLQVFSGSIVKEPGA